MRTQSDAEGGDLKLGNLKSLMTSRPPRVDKACQISTSIEDEGIDNKEFNERERGLFRTESGDDSDVGLHRTMTKGGESDEQTKHGKSKAQGTRGRDHPKNMHTSPRWQLAVLGLGSSVAG